MCTGIMIRLLKFSCERWWTMCDTQLVDNIFLLQNQYFNYRLFKLLLVFFKLLTLHA